MQSVVQFCASASALCPCPDYKAKSTGVTAKNSSNEFRPIEESHEIFMETCDPALIDQPEAPPTSPSYRRIVDLSKRIVDNSPTHYAVSTNNRFIVLGETQADEQTASTSSAVKGKAAETAHKQTTKPAKQGRSDRLCS